MENQEILRVKNLKTHFNTDEGIVKAVDGVSFALHKGETLGIVGESGCGKSVMNLSVMRLIPSPPGKIMEGDILFHEKSVLVMSEDELRSLRGNKVSMIFQDPMTALNPIMKVGEQISEVIKLHNKISQREATERAIKMLETVGIPGDRFNEYPHQFSGGMKQRVVIAIALACSPELLLADEPTTALDVTIQAQVLEMIAKLKRDFNTSMIMISHNLGVVAEVCDDLAVIYAGEIVELGDREAVFDHPSHPYTLGLFGAVPTLAEDKERLNPITGLPPDPSNLPGGCHFNPRCSLASEECRQEKITLREITPGHFCRCIKVNEEGINAAIG
jgi:peptide/nickel transport system ATP-binding protein